VRSDMLEVVAPGSEPLTITTQWGLLLAQHFTSW